jgi:hypothetical protein
MEEYEIVTLNGNGLYKDLTFKDTFKALLKQLLDFIRKIKKP